jgi:hypothetical protein
MTGTPIDVPVPRKTNSIAVSFGAIWSREPCHNPAPPAIPTSPILELDGVEAVPVRGENHRAKATGFIDDSRVMPSAHAHISDIVNRMPHAVEDSIGCPREILVEQKGHATAS